MKKFMFIFIILTIVTEVAKINAQGYSNKQKDLEEILRAGTNYIEYGEIKKALVYFQNGLVSAKSKSNDAYIYKFRIMRSISFAAERNFHKAVYELEQLKNEIGEEKIARLNISKQPEDIDFDTYSEYLLTYYQIKEKGPKNIIKTIIDQLTIQNSRADKVSAQLDIAIIYFIEGDIKQSENILSEIIKFDPQNETTQDALFLLNSLQAQENSGVNAFYSEFTGKAMPIDRFIKRMQQRKITRYFSIFDWVLVPSKEDETKWEKIPVHPAYRWKNRNIPIDTWKDKIH